MITGENAVNGVQTLEVEQMAKTGYLTGGVIGGGNKNFTALSTLKDVMGGFTGDKTITVTKGNSAANAVNITVQEDTTISHSSKMRD